MGTDTRHARAPADQHAHPSPNHADRNPYAPLDEFHTATLSARENTNAPPARVTGRKRREAKDGESSGTVELNADALGCLSRRGLFVSQEVGHDGSLSQLARKRPKSHLYMVGAPTRHACGVKEGGALWIVQAVQPGLLLPGLWEQAPAAARRVRRAKGTIGRAGTRQLHGDASGVEGPSLSSASPVEPTLVLGGPASSSELRG
jgi:hypothetical protein